MALSDERLRFDIDDENAEEKCVCVCLRATKRMINISEVKFSTLESQCRLSNAIFPAAKRFVLPFARITTVNYVISMSRTQKGNDFSVPCRLQFFFFFVVALFVLSRLQALSVWIVEWQDRTLVYGVTCHFPHVTSSKWKEKNAAILCHFVRLSFLAY